MELPDALKLDFVSEQPEYVCTDEPNMTIEDLEEDIQPMIEKKKISQEDIFSSSDAVKLEASLKNEETGEENPNFVYSDDDEVAKETSKKTIKDNINEQLNEIKPDIKIDKEKPVKLNKNGKPRKKRVYTDEQKEQMRERMKHARATAYKNKEKKQAEKDKELKYKKLLKQKRDMEIEEIEEKIQKKNNKSVKPQVASLKEDKEVNRETPNKGEVKVNHNENINKYKDVLKQAQFEAIAEYEKIRKARKEKKKQEKQVQEYHETVKQNLKKELSWRDVAGEYADCF